jgi:hypothetical protein
MRMAVLLSIGSILSLGSWWNAAISHETDRQLAEPARQQLFTGESSRLAQRAADVGTPDVSATGNPTIAPLKWTGLLLNYEAFERDGKKYNTLCTGQFISPTVILTAAHCVQNEETGALYDLKKMYFLAQYQNNTFSQVHRPVCLSRFDGWVPRKDALTSKAIVNRWQWDYAMILVDRPSSTGFYHQWMVDWRGKFRDATVTGYPAAILAGQIIQQAHGDIFTDIDVPNVVAIKHNNSGVTQGSSGGAWVANFGKEEDTEHNIVISLNSFGNKEFPGYSFGPYLTPDFNHLFEYVSKGCPR